MATEFEWNDEKALSNRLKHGVGFEEASTGFYDALSITIPDPLHSVGESRHVLIGQCSTGRLLVVVHGDKGAKIRIISARTATRRERRIYEETN